MEFRVAQTILNPLNPLNDSGTYVYYDCDCNVTKAHL